MSIVPDKKSMPRIAGQDDMRHGFHRETYPKINPLV